MRFQTVFLAVLLATALVVAAMVLHGKRPEWQLEQPSASHVTAGGKCASCHRQETGAVVHEFEASRHAPAGVTCLDCHQPVEGQDSVEHRGFTISTALTAKNCAQCHSTQYEQFLRSRHAAPAYGAVAGSAGFTPEQIAHAESYHPGTVERAPNALARLEGESAISSGCIACHRIGAPNSDGSIGRCTECHSRHNASISLARAPETCGQCHMGPDHSQLEIYSESKHGVLFSAQKHLMNLEARPDELTTKDMPVPTCATCHVSGLEDLAVTHDVGERLSWYLFAPISKKRPAYQAGKDAMQGACKTCHASTEVERFYSAAEEVVESTNGKIQRILDVEAELRAEGLLTPEPFDEELEFLVFDLWHYFGRTAKHGAFMGGADFVQWHGNYELLHLGVQIDELARELREGH